jgi:CBS domain containing-hemolysin-like protein
MMTDVVSVSSRAKLLEMVLQLVDTQADGLIVLDEFGRPAGIVSAKDILKAVVGRVRRRAKAGKERSAARKPK